MSVSIPLYACSELISASYLFPNSRVLKKKYKLNVKLMLHGALFWDSFNNLKDAIFDSMKQGFF
jgi:hypothetical protein